MVLSLEAAEKVDSKEKLEVDDEQYPLLPSSVLEFRLKRRKAVVGQFMGLARSLWYYLSIQHVLNIL